MADKKKQTTVRLEESLILECKKYCLDKGIHFQDYIATLLVRDRENREKETK